MTLSVFGSNSLKDKRQVVKSLLATVRNRFNVSAAEVGRLDSRRLAQLGFACVSNDAVLVNSMLSKILAHLESNPLCEVTHTEMELI